MSRRSSIGRLPLIVYRSQLSKIPPLDLRNHLGRSVNRRATGFFDHTRRVVDAIGWPCQTATRGSRAKNWHMFKFSLNAESEAKGLTRNLFLLPRVNLVESKQNVARLPTQNSGDLRDLLNLRDSSSSQIYTKRRTIAQINVRTVSGRNLIVNAPGHFSSIAKIWALLRPTEIPTISKYNLFIYRRDFYFQFAPPLRSPQDTLVNHPNYINCTLSSRRANHVL